MIGVTLAECVEPVVVEVVAIMNSGGEVNIFRFLFDEVRLVPLDDFPCAWWKVLFIRVVGGVGICRGRVNSAGGGGGGGDGG